MHADEESHSGGGTSEKARNTLLPGTIVSRNTLRVVDESGAWPTRFRVWGLRTRNGIAHIRDTHAVVLSAVCSRPGVPPFTGADNEGVGCSTCNLAHVIDRGTTLPVGCRVWSHGFALIAPGYIGGISLMRKGNPGLNGSPGVAVASCIRQHAMWRANEQGGASRRRACLRGQRSTSPNALSGPDPASPAGGACPVFAERAGGRT